jgi:hypothetical protein
MLFKHKRLLTELRKNGRHATAEADLAGEMHWMADAERLAHRHDQRLGLVWTPIGSGLLPSRPGHRGRGRLQVTVSLLANHGIQRSVSWMSSSASPCSRA